MFTSANWEKYQSDLTKKINTFNQPISIEEITNVRQESARQNIKKT
jgi:hypothetical protein